MVVYNAKSNKVSEKINGPVSQKTKKRKISNDPNWSTQKAPKSLPSIKKIIHLTASEWKKLDLKTKTFTDNREYEVFEAGWPDKFTAMYGNILNFLVLSLSKLRKYQGTVIFFYLSMVFVTNAVNDAHAMLAVEDLKSHPKYSEALHEIALNKMYVMYWLPVSMQQEA